MRMIHPWALLWVCLLTVTPALAGSVPIRLDAPLPDHRPHAPVTFGVPFPSDALPVNQLGTIRIVDDLGNVVLHQQRVTAMWDAMGTHGVRWLLIDLQVDPQRQYVLHFGQDVPADRPIAQDIARVEGDRIVINAGAITGSLPTRGGFDPFTQLQSMGAPMAQPIDEPAPPLPTLPAGVTTDSILGQRILALREPAKFNGLYVEHETQGIYRSDLDPDATLTLEETGPLRATLKADGWYVNSKGEKFCRYSVRLHIYRDKPDLKLEHTFIYTGMSDKDRLVNVGLRFNRMTPDLAKRARGYIGGDDLATGQAIAQTTGNDYIIQDNSERHRFDFYALREAGSVVKIDNKGGGWIYYLGQHAFSVAIRDAWQQFPWGLRFRQGMMDVQLWPQAAAPLDTTWDGYFAWLTDHQRRTLASNMERREKNLDKWLATLRTSTYATGAAKTHELWLAFSGPDFARFPTGETVASSHMAREVAYPVLAMADPAWMCASQALDLQPHFAPSPLHHGQEEEAFDAVLTLMQDAIAANHWYGWWDWGAYHQLPDSHPMFTRNGLWIDDAGVSRWHRARPKSHYQWGRFPWVQYMRTGDRKWLRYAQTYTLYSADRAQTHHTGHDRDNGGEYHYDNSVVPWLGGSRFHPAGDQISSNLQAKDDYVYMYWLTGSQRALDVLKANGELILNRVAAGSKLFTWKPGFERGNDIRNAGMQLDRLLILYQATFDERYLTLARSIADSFKPLNTPEKVAEAEKNPPAGLYHQALSWAYQGMWFYWKVTEDESFRPALLAFINRARDYNGAMPGNGAPRALGYGYLLTGNTFYLDMMRAAVDDFAARGVTRYTFSPSYKQELATIPGALGVMSTAPPEWLAHNWPLQDRGRTASFRYVNPGTNPGKAAPTVIFHETTDKPWSFTLITSSGGSFQLTDEHGKVVLEKTIGSDNVHWARFDIPSDGRTGDFTLTCTQASAHILAAPNADLPPTARIVRSDLPCVYQFGDRRAMLQAVARTYYFKLAPDALEPYIFLYRIAPQREVRVFEVDGLWSMSTQGQMPRAGGSRELMLPTSMKNVMLGMTFVQRGDQVFDPQGVLPSLMRAIGTQGVFATEPDQCFTPAQKVGE